MTKNLYNAVFRNHRPISAIKINYYPCNTISQHTNKLETKTLEAIILYFVLNINMLLYSDPEPRSDDQMRHQEARPTIKTGKTKLSNYQTIKLSNYQTIKTIKLSNYQTINTISYFFNSLTLTGHSHLQALICTSIRRQVQVRTAVSSGEDMGTR